jgi:hypothetical protein
MITERKVNFNDNIQIRYYEIDEIAKKRKTKNSVNKYIKKFLCKCKNLNLKPLNKYLLRGFLSKKK